MRSDISELLISETFQGKSVPFPHRGFLSQHTRQGGVWPIHSSGSDTGGRHEAEDLEDRLGLAVGLPHILRQVSTAQDSQRLP